MAIFKIVALLMLVFVAMMVIKSVISGSKYKQVVATVTEVEVSERLKDDGSRYTAYVPIYSYEIDGTTYTARGSVSEGSSKYDVGDTRKITYNVNNPKEVHLRRESKNKNLVGTAMIIAGIIIVVVAFLFT